MGNKIRKAFNAAAACGAFAATLTFSGLADAKSPLPPNRPPMAVSEFQRAVADRSSGKQALTPSEKALVRGVFGNDINVDAIRKEFHSRYRSDAAAWVDSADPNTIHFWGLAYHSRDYSRERNTYKFSVFLHEVTHVWQFQHGARSNAGHCYKYEYELKPNSRFGDFCDEQQGAIMEDYARRFLAPVRDEAYRSLDAGGRKVPDYINDAHLREIVETRFPAARALRLRLQPASLRLHHR
jgi:hypothetical protein